VVLSRDVSPENIPDLLSALEGLGQRLEESGKDVAEAQTIEAEMKELKVVLYAKFGNSICLKCLIGPLSLCRP